MKNLKVLIENRMLAHRFDQLSVGVIDFANGKFETYEYGTPNIVYDLASLTKPFTLFLLYNKFKKLFTNTHLALLDHTAGLPSGGRLSRKNWKEQILSYELSPGSETNYSDFGPLRLMLLLEQEIDFQKEVEALWGRDIVHWQQLSKDANCAITGVRQRKDIRGVVQDHNAYVLNSFCAHSGAFASLNGVCNFLLRFNNDFDFIHNVPHNNKQRFSFGWDQGVDPSRSLAGKFIGDFVFGHLGFTGTSVWIDPRKKIGHVILSNGCLNGWYDRVGLNNLRKEIGTYIWNDYEFK